MYSEWLESDLITAARDGDANAFAELVRRVRPMFVKVATSIVKDPAGAEDHVQTAFLKAWQNLDAFREDAKFSTWMTSIVTNECLMELRSRRRAAAVSIEPDEDGRQLQIADPRPTSEQDIGSAQVASLVASEMKRVPAPLRGVLVASEVDKSSIQEVAGRFGLSVDAAKSRLYRARKELRRRMERHTGRMGAATLIA